MDKLLEVRELDFIIARADYKNDKKNNEKSKKENRSKNGTSEEALEKLYEIHGYQFCTSCGKKIPKFMDLCEECSKNQD